MKRYKNFGIFAVSIIAVIFYANCAVALNWNDPGIVPVQNKNGQWVDQKTKRFINVQGMQQASNSSTYNTPNTTPVNDPSNTPGNTPGNPPGNTSGPNNATSTSKLSKVGRVAGGVVGVTLGTAGLVDAVSGQNEHNWGDVLQGAVSLGSATAAGASALNAFVGIGNVAYAITVASGALVGGLVAGSQLFSETDCLYDPVTGKFTCCHTQFNQGERYADIGEYMFCSKANQDGTETIFKPAVRQCVQGNMNNKDTWTGKKSSWISGLWKDDFWTPECEIRICDNVLPQSGIDEYIDYTPDTEHFCWNWSCINGYTRSGNTCVKSDGTRVSPKADDYDSLVQKIQAERSRILQECGKYQNSQSTSTTK